MQYQHHFKLICLISCTGFLAACQSTPVHVTPAPKPTPTITTPTPPVVENTARRTPLPSAGQPPLQSTPLPSTSTPVLPSYKPPQPNITLRDGSNIPAFRGLIDRAQQQLKNNQLNEAEQTLIQAQRMAPQSTAVYAYLSEIAIKKGQGSNAEAMARKGLMFARSAKQKSGFWQLILISGKVQNNAILVAQARDNIQRLAGQF